MTMDAFGSYLLKSAVWLTGFAIVYLLFLRNERFFKLKRIYLLTGILASFIFPILTIHYRVDILSPVSAYTAVIPADQGTGSSSGFSALHYQLTVKDLLAVLYVAGILFIFIRSAIHLIRLHKIIKRSGSDNRGTAKLIRTAEYSSSFAFFNYVFINPSVNKDEVNEIMNHELVHVTQKHWFDLLLGEVLRMMQWINPFAWIYTGFIRLNHEYLADEAAIQYSLNPAIYKAALLNQIFRSPVISLSNPFNYSMNKTRFEMMKKITASPYRKLKVLIILPVITLVFYAFAKPEYHYAMTDENSPAVSQALLSENITVSGRVLKSDESPLPGAIIILTGTSKGAVTGPDGKFALKDVPDDASLEISCTGYLTQKVKAGTKKLTIHLVFNPEYKEISDAEIKTEMKPDFQQFNVRAQGDNPPMLIVDDKTVDYESIKSLNTENIESVTVLKDGAAVRKYGEKAKDGVIIIITKNHQQKPVSGLVVNEEGIPVGNVNIMVTGSEGNARGATTANDGKFTFDYIQPDAIMIFSCRGYKNVSLKPDYSKGMTVKMVKDPDYKPEPGQQVQIMQRPEYLVVIDDVVSDMKYTDVSRTLGYNMGVAKFLRGKDATDKYGEKGANGVYEIITRKKALEMGLKPPFPRLAPDDYPTFQGQRYSEFNKWVGERVKYPSGAEAKNIEGWVSINFSVGLDGTLANLTSIIPVDPLLSDEVMRVVRSAPAWDPPKNKNVDEPFSSGITIRFKLPGEITSEAPFVVVEEMPVYPGGDIALLEFIKNNTKYPEKAKAEKIEGRVIVRFVVTKEGNTEAVSVLKGVDPLLDAEAIRVVSTIKGWKPGTQEGKPLNVWYMVPITFALPKDGQPK